MLSQEQDGPLPKGFYKKFKDLKQATPEKDLNFSNYIMHRAISFADEQPYMILLFNHSSKIFEKDRDLALTLYLQEMFYLCARFGGFARSEQMKYSEGGEEPCNINSCPLLDFKNFVVEGDKFAFLMAQTHSLKELMERKEEEKQQQRPFFVEIGDMIEDVYSSINYANSRFGISNIDIRPESIFAVATNSQESNQQKIEYYLTNWTSGARAELAEDSVLSLSEMENIQRFVELEKDKEDPRKKFISPEIFQSSYLRADTAAEMSSLGLVLLEYLGVEYKAWKSLLVQDDIETYDFVLKKILERDVTKILKQQPVQSKLSQESSLQIKDITDYLSTLLKKEPLERIQEFKKLVSTRQNRRKMKKQKGISGEEEEKQIDELQREKEEIKRKEKEYENDDFKLLEKLMSYYDKLNKKVRELLNEASPSSIRTINLANKGLNFIDGIVVGLNNQWIDLNTLELLQNEIGNEGAVAIGKNNSWSQLINLSLSANKIGDEGAEAIGKNTIWTNLEELWLNENQIGDKGAVAIGSNTKWKNLKKLMLQTNRIGDEGAEAIGKNSTWKNLEELSLFKNQMGNKGATMIGSNTTWKNLKKLMLQTNKIGDEGAVAIGKNNSWSQLTHLSLSVNKIGDEGAEAVGKNTTWTNLEELWLAQNQIGDKGATVIGNNAIWEKLKALSLWSNKIGDQGAEAIRKNFAWNNLEVLRLNHNNIGDFGAYAIANNKIWKNLKEFYMWGNPLITEEGILSLKRNEVFGNVVNFEKQPWMHFDY